MAQPRYAHPGVVISLNAYAHTRARAGVGAVARRYLRQQAVAALDGARDELAMSIRIAERMGVISRWISPRDLEALAHPLLPHPLTAEQLIIAVVEVIDAPAGATRARVLLSRAPLDSLDAVRELSALPTNRITPTTPTNPTGMAGETGEAAAAAADVADVADVMNALITRACQLLRAQAGALCNLGLLTARCAVAVITLDTRTGLWRSHSA